MAVHKHQSRAGKFGEGEFIQRLGFCAVDRRRIKYRRKRQLRERRDIGETPVFVLKRREAEFSEQGEPRLAEWQQR